jgi:hypothetical protein
MIASMQALAVRAGGPLLAISMMMGCGPAGSDPPAGESGSSTTAPVPSDSSGPPPGTSTVEPPGTSTMGATSASATGSTTGEEDPTENPISFDQGIIPDSPKLDMGCRKVDFLFIVDNSGSMSAQQAQLLASFPGFITAMQDALDGVVDSYHVGVLTSDNYAGNAPGCTTIGDLVTQTSGFGAAGQVCTPFDEGGRFATEQDDLEEKFPCMAQVGTSGSPIEQPVTALIASFDPAKRGPGDCNEDFLRDDAILVVVIVTDDPPYDFDMDDAHPLTDTSTWYDDVIAGKNDDPEALVVIGFIPWGDTSCVFGGGLGSESPNLIGFVDSFGKQGVKASICEPDFGPVFASTIETIVTTCENFDPPG